MPAYDCKPSKGKSVVLLTGIAFVFASSFLSFDLRSVNLPFIYLRKSTIYNLLHVPLFIFITILWLQIIQVYRLSAWQRGVSALLFSSSVGVLYEVVQILLPGRNASLTDILINLGASTFGILIYLRVERARPSLVRKIVCDDP